MNYRVCNLFLFFVDNGKAGNDSFLFNRWSYDDVQVLVVFWRRIEVHNVWYLGNNCISSIMALFTLFTISDNMRFQDNAYYRVTTFIAGAF
ncbi:hypothetical protein Hdeb2414_s0004g00121481 [Helianthus debilis subsp. tardiflorus]